MPQYMYVYDAYIGERDDTPWKPCNSESIKHNLVMSILQV